MLAVIRLLVLLLYKTMSHEDKFNDNSSFINFIQAEEDKLAKASSEEIAQACYQLICIFHNFVFAAGFLFWDY